MSGSGVGSILGGVGSLVGAAGDIYSAFQKPPSAGGNKPYTGLISTPAFNFGGGTLQRTNNDFLQGQRRVRGLLGDQMGRVQPGFGALTQSGVNAIRQRAAEASGNLRAQLGRRGLMGASFADDALTRVGNEYQQAENEFRTQAFIQEMNATNELIDRESVSLLTQAQQELQELGIATSFLSGVNQVATTQKEIDKILKQQELMAQLNPQPAAGGVPGHSVLPPDTGPGGKVPIGGKPAPGGGGGTPQGPRRPPIRPFRSSIGQTGQNRPARRFGGGMINA